MRYGRRQSEHMLGFEWFATTLSRSRTDLRANAVLYPLSFDANVHERVHVVQGWFENGFCVCENAVPFDITRGGGYMDRGGINPETYC